ncbi:MAG: PHP domain-containing protein [bacterium]|nr:PHP domain-containing protein [bacterium]
MNNNNFLKRLGNLFLFLVFSILVIRVSIHLYLKIPSPHVYKNGEWEWKYVPEYDKKRGNIRFDPHSHSTYSNGVLSPEQCIQYHIAMGFNACVISDKLKKNSGWEGSVEAQKIARKKYKDEIKVLVGLEYTSHRGHLNVVFPPGKNSFKNKIPYYGKNPTKSELKSFIKAIHDLGGIVILDHLVLSYKNLPAHLSRKEFLELGVDYIEIINGGIFDKKSYEFCKKNNLGMLASTGMHIPEETSVRAWTLLNVNKFTEQAIFDQLKARNNSILSQDYPVEYKSKHQKNLTYTVLRPFIQMGGLILEYIPWGASYNFQAILILITHLSGLFLLAKFIRYGFSKIYEKVKSY